MCNASLTLKNSTFCPHSLFMSFVWISEQTAIISLYSINWLVFITECVYSAVRTGSNVIQSIVSLWKLIWNTPSPPCMLIFQRVLSMSRTYRVLHLLVRWVLLQEDELFVHLLCHIHRNFHLISPHIRITVTCTAGHATLPPHCFHITEIPTVFPERRSNQSAPACVTLLVVTAIFLGMRPRSGPSAC